MKNNNKNMKKKLLIASIVLFVLIILSIIFIYCWKTRTEPDIEISDIPYEDDIFIPSSPMIYGFVEDSFNIKQDIVKKNQTLVTILQTGNLEFNLINCLTELCNPVFDVRRIRAGNKYTFLMCKDSLNTPAYFIYEIDNIDYLLMTLTDSATVSRFRKQVNIINKTGSGTITSSLWNATKENDLNPILAINLSDIYAWTIDFFGIEKGDYFKIIYEEMYVEDVSAGIMTVYASLFKHRGKEYYAFYYEQDSIWGYFDENGQSLRKAFLKAPLNYSRISSRFSNSRFHPVLKINRPHHGVDYAAPEGTPVYSIGDGHITHKGWDAKGGGNYMKIKHNSVYTSVYMHFKGFAKGIKQGDHVRQGELIGYVGKTGLATGPHLDFRVYKNGTPIDPLKVEAPPVEPIKDDMMAAFLEYITPLKNKLTFE
jgi:murein DD-endopeptidase MepM/ murein hydrolase activator NlpD